MLKKFLRDAINLVVGKQAEEIVELLDTEKYVNEFILAKKLDITINQTRNILYKLSDHGLVSSIRKKDKKKGWYTYFWKIEALKALEFVKNNIIKRISQLENQIRRRETNRFYVCKRCNIELNEENALLHGFVCRECGDVLKLKDNTKVIREMKKKRGKLKKDLEFIGEEIKKEKEKIERKKIKELKKEERAKKRKLRRRRRKRKKERMKKKGKKSKKKTKKSSKKSKKKKKKSRKKVSKKPKKKSGKKKTKKRKPKSKSKKRKRKKAKTKKKKKRRKAKKKKKKKRKK